MNFFTYRLHTVQLLRINRGHEVVFAWENNALFVALASSVRMIRTSVESAAKRYNKKVTKITVAAVAVIATNIIFLHRVRKRT